MELRHGSLKWTNFPVHSIIIIILDLSDVLKIVTHNDVNSITNMLSAFI